MTIDELLPATIWPVMPGRSKPYGMRPKAQHEQLVGCQVAKDAHGIAGLDPAADIDALDRCLVADACHGPPRVGCLVLPSDEARRNDAERLERQAGPRGEVDRGPGRAPAGNAVARRRDNATIGIRAGDQ